VSAKTIRSLHEKISCLQIVHKVTAFRYPANALPFRPFPVVAKTNDVDVDLPMRQKPFVRMYLRDILDGESARWCISNGNDSGFDRQVSDEWGFCSIGASTSTSLVLRQRKGRKEGGIRGSERGYFGTICNKKFLMESRVVLAALMKNDTTIQI